MSTISTPRHVSGAARRCWDETDPAHPGKIDFPPKLFANLQDVSIDYAVMEKHDDVAVVEARFDWSDIGSWEAVAELAAADTDGNRISGEAITMESDGRAVAAFCAGPGIPRRRSIWPTWPASIRPECSARSWAKTGQWPDYPNWSSLPRTST